MVYMCHCVCHCVWVTVLKKAIVLCISYIFSCKWLWCFVKFCNLCTRWRDTIWGWIIVGFCTTFCFICFQDFVLRRSWGWGRKHFNLYVYRCSTRENLDPAVVKVDEHKKLYIRGSFNKFLDIFVWALLLIVHTWNSSPLRSNLPRLQCTCCIIPTTSGRLNGSPLVWACQWP